MSNVVQFPGKTRPAGRVEAVTSDLHEALWISAFLIQDWEEFAFDVGGGRVSLVDAEGRLDPNPVGAEPTATLAGTKRTVSEVVSMGSAIDPAKPLPPHMLIFFAIWNVDDGENPILTYGDAVEMMDGALGNVEDERSQVLASKGSA